MNAPVEADVEGLHAFGGGLRDLLRVAFSTHIFSLTEPKDCQFGAECALPITNEAGEVERRLQFVLQILSRRNPGLPSAYARQ